MGGRGASGTSVSNSNSIKSQLLDAGLNSKFAGVRRDAANGAGTYNFKDAKAVSPSTAIKMTDIKIVERNGNTLVYGLIGQRKVFYAAKSTDKTVQALIKKKNKQSGELSKGNTNIRTTSTYDRWKKNNQKKFDAWFGKR